MTVALSSAESTKKIYETGFQGFSTGTVLTKAAPQLALALVDFDQILQQKNPRKKIQALPPQIVYHSLIARGIHDCLEVLPHLSTEQFVRICDYDVWDEDQLVAKRLFAWLDFYREISPKQMYERFRSLDEEYQLAVMAPRVRLYTPEEYEKMSDEQQDSLYRLPGDAMFYAIDSEEQEVHQGIEHLIDAAMAEDMIYAVSVLSHSSYQLVGEAEMLMQQFRTARLEEDGFVTYAESMKIFVPMPWAELLRQWPVLTPPAASEIQELISRNERHDASALFLHQVLTYGAKSAWSEEKNAELQRSFLQLSNALCTACHIGCDDIHGLKRLLAHSQGLCSLALEVLSGGSVERGAEILLASASPQLLFRAALALVEQLRQVVVETLIKTKTEGASQVAKYQKFHKTGALLDYLDRTLLSVLGFEEVELLKGLFNRLPLVPQGDVALGTSGGAQRIFFAPLARRSDLQQCWGRVQGLLVKLRVAAETLQGETIVDVERTLLERFAQFIGSQNVELAHAATALTTDLSRYAGEVVLALDAQLPAHLDFLAAQQTPEAVVELSFSPLLARVIAEHRSH